MVPAATAVVATSVVMMAAAVVVMSAAAVVMMVVMVTVRIRIIDQIASCQRFCGCICRALHTGIECDAGISQCHLRAGADPAADQGVDLCGLQEASQRAVPVAVGVDYLCSDDLAVFYVVYLELFGMPEVLKYHAVFICYCDSH